MFASRMKKVRYLFVLLSTFTSQFSLAQEQAEDDSTFNALDYYSGRIAQGLGGGFEQQVSGKKFGVRGFASSPFAYGNIGSRISVRFSNNTSWSEFDDSLRALRGFDKNALQTNLVQLRYRRAGGLMLEAQGNFSHSKVSGAIDNGSKYDHERDTRAYGLAASYYSQGGRLRLTPRQLAFQYYAFPRPAVEFQPHAFRFLTPGQFMLGVRSDYRKFHAETQIVDVPNDYFSSGEFDERSFILPELNFVYAWKEQITLALAAQSLHGKSESAQRVPDREQDYSNNTDQIIIAPKIYYFSAERILHRFSARWSALDSKGENVDHFAGNGTYKVANKFNSNSWSYDYTLHVLSAIAPPSLRAFLADWNDDFGNRLPPGVLHLALQASVSSFAYGNERTSQDMPVFIINDDETRTYSGAVQGLYGLTNDIELNAQWNYFRSRQERWNFEPSPARTLQKNEQWTGSFMLRFANYRFEERYQSRFGWEQLREYDRLYGPLLLRGMLSGFVAVTYSDYSSNTEEDFGAAFRNDHRQARVQARLGVLDNVELRATGQLEKLSEISKTAKQYQIAVAWQPWNSIRFQARHSKNMPNPLSSVYLPSDVLWSFQITSLF